MANPMMTLDDAFALLKSQLENPEYPEGWIDPTDAIFDMDAVRALLAGYEANRPRVLTLREVQCYQDCPVLWVERSGYDARSEWMNTNYVMNNYSHPDMAYSSMYDIFWRCWTRRPTKEQSDSTPWERGLEPGGEVKL